MLDKLDEWGPITVLILIISTIVVGGGVVVVIVNPETLTFAQLLDTLKTFVLGLGALGIGRGLHAGLTNAGIALHLPATDPTERAPTDASPQAVDTPPGG